MALVEAARAESLTIQRHGQAGAAGFRLSGGARLLRRPALALSATNSQRPHLHNAAIDQGASDAEILWQWLQLRDGLPNGRIQHGADHPELVELLAAAPSRTEHRVASWRFPGAEGGAAAAAASQDL